MVCSSITLECALLNEIFIVMDAEKESTCAWLLFEELAKRYEQSLLDNPDIAGENDAYVPYWKACEVMTRSAMRNPLMVPFDFSLDPTSWNRWT